MKYTKNDHVDENNETLSSAYVLAEQWKSDLDFYADELNFLNVLISKYFISLLGEQDFPSLPKLVARLKETKVVREELTRDAILYMSKIKLLIVNDPNSEEFNQKKESIKLKASITLFTRNFMSLKRQIFARIEEVMEHEKMKRLIQA
jgi:hypothetical protein